MPVVIDHIERSCKIEGKGSRRKRNENKILGDGPSQTFFTVSKLDSGWFTSRKVLTIYSMVIF